MKRSCCSSPASAPSARISPSASPVSEPSISVDIHVHRIVNRWGYVLTRTPEQTMLALEEKLPREYWIEINALLVPFGKHICTGTAPRCSTCPVRHMCPKIGVTTHR